jgi:putative sterol carrier protein
MAESVEAFFNNLESRVDPEKTKGMNATFQFNITGDGGGEWHVAFAEGQAKVQQGQAESPNITLSASDADWLDIVNGRQGGQTAFLTGKLKIQGDMSLAMKLQALLG